MSRSRRKNPVTGFTTATSEKEDKRLDHRAERAAVRDALAHQVEPPRRPRGQYFDKDGKQRFRPEDHPELMRK
jgi:hypothetical protein